jgi:hypothetical protein
MISSKSIHWSRQLRLIIIGFIIVTFTILHTLLTCHESNNADDRRHLVKARSEIFMRGRNFPGPGNVTKLSSASLRNPTPYPSAQGFEGGFSTRVACIIPYIGPSLPVWFDAFAFSALSSSPMFDYLIFVTEVPRRELPSNVKIIRISSSNFYERIARLDQSDVSEYTFQQNMLSAEMLMTLFPYALVEFKPCLGVIFSDYLTTYSHWALADLDVLVGKMHTIITPSILNQYDIYTSSFGDNLRLYMRGQLTILKNNKYVNNAWRGCHHLSHLTQRFKAFRESGFKVWEFQSAEGCYSSVVGTYISQ